MSATSGPSRLWPIVVAIVLLCFINLPLGHLKWTDHRPDRDGVETTAEVTDSKAFGGKFFITFRLPAALVPDQESWTVEVSRQTFEEAKADEQRSEEHKSECQSPMSISHPAYCSKTKNNNSNNK